MSAELVVAIIACGITAVSVVVGAVWAVGKIQSTTESLKLSIDHLAATVADVRMSVGDVKSWLGAVALTQGRHGERIARVEARLDVCEEDGE